MMKYLRRVYVVYFYSLFLVIFLLLYPGFRFLLSNPKRYIKAHRLRRFWGKALTFLGFVKMKTILEDKIQPDPNKTYLVVANHASYLDIISLSCQVPVDLNFMAKNELASIPLFGIFFRTIDIPVNRKSTMHSGKAYLRAKNQLIEKTMSLAIFPEGGIKPIVPKLSPFKKGPFQMAIECGVPILPISLPDNFTRGPGTHFDGSPGLMRAVIHAPIETKGLTVDDADVVKEKVFHIIEKTLNKYNSN